MVSPTVSLSICKRGGAFSGASVPRITMPYRCAVKARELKIERANLRCSPTRRLIGLMRRFFRERVFAKVRCFQGKISADSRKGSESGPCSHARQRPSNNFPSTS